MNQFDNNAVFTTRFFQESLENDTSNDYTSSQDMDLEYEPIISEWLENYVKTKNYLNLYVDENKIFNESRYEHCLIGCFIDNHPDIEIIMLDNNFWELYENKINSVNLNAQDKYFINTFSNMDYFPQYRPDLVFIYGDILCHVEIDENNHNNYNIQYEIEREDILKKAFNKLFPQYNYMLLRFNCKISSFNSNYSRFKLGEEFNIFIENNFKY